MFGEGIGHAARQEDPRLSELLTQLFSDAVAKGGYELFASRSPLAGAVSPRWSVRLWRAWMNARTAVAQGTPLAGFRELQRSMSQSPPSETVSIAYVECMHLLGRCLLAGHNSLAAAQAIDEAGAALEAFIRRLAEDRESCADELWEMVEAITNTDAAAVQDRDAIVGAWAATRGLELTMEVARSGGQLLTSEPDADLATADEVRRKVAVLEQQAAVTFGARAHVAVEFALGDILTVGHPEQAMNHFEVVARTLGTDDGRGLSAAVNVANCLLRAGQFVEAETRYGALESAFELRGDLEGAARVWAAECIANWKRRHDPDVRPGVVGAIRLFEEALPSGTDVMTRYQQKTYIEQAYKLLITVNATSTDRSEARQDEMLSAIWAIMSRDLLANLEPEVNDDDPWDPILQRARRPLVTMKHALSQLHGTAVVHLISGIDRLVWVVYGYSPDGEFEFEAAALEAECADRLASLLHTMHEQLDADRVGDALAVAAMQSKLEQIGVDLAADLPTRWADVVRSMDRLIYLPDPFGNVDEFPLGALRLDDARWLCEDVPIVRSASVTQLREVLSPNRAVARPQGRAVVFAGATELGGELLVEEAKERSRATHMLNALGFTAETPPTVTVADIVEWLNGGAGALHYVGHGIANEVFEGLPLPGDQYFSPIAADRIDGARTPFAFLCACVAGRVRSGTGGYQIGLASKIVERGSPAVVAFSMPVTEARAYALAGRFYRRAAELPFGEAVREAIRDLAPSVPAHALLCLTAYGDPAFRLTSMASSGDRARTLADETAEWTSALRNHCVLRTPGTATTLRATTAQVPPRVAAMVTRWLDTAFQEPAEPDARRDVLLESLEKFAYEAQGLSDPERLSLRAAVCAERLHASGLETVPILVATDPTSIRRMLNDARFLAVLGGALMDPRLNGLGNSLMGRVITVDQNDAQAAALFLREGREKLLECDDQSEFVNTLRHDDRRILEHFGLDL